MKLAQNVQAIFDALRVMLGKTFSTEALIRYVEQQRGKPVRIELHPLRPDIDGCCLAFKDLDLIWIQEHLSPLLQRTTRFHELSHLLLGHIPLLPYGENTLTYAEFMEDYSLELAEAHRGHGYSAPQEHDAEMLSTLVLTCIEDDDDRRESGIMRNLHR